MASLVSVIDGCTAYVYSPSSFKNVFIFLHGLGDTGEGWTDLIQKYKSLGNKDDTKFIFPNAPVMSVTMNFGLKMPSWWDIFSLDPLGKQDEVNMHLETKKITKIVQKEISEGVNPKNVILGGFSQGGALAYMTGIQLPFTLGGIIGISGWIPLTPECNPEKPIQSTAQSRNTKIRHFHGIEDQLVHIKWAVESVDYMKDQLEMADVQMKTYNTQHCVNDQEMKDILDFMTMTFKQ